MSLQPGFDVSLDASEHELKRIQHGWWWLLLLGILLVVCGVLAITFPYLASAGVAIVIGTVLLLSGIATIVASFWTGKWSAFLLQLLVGILYVVLGLAITESPGKTAIVLTILVASFMIVGGIFRCVSALVIQYPQWGWSLLNGVITTVLGIVIFRHFPEAGVAIIGILVGVELLFNGVTWIMLSLAVRSLISQESPANPG